MKNLKEYKEILISEKIYPNIYNDFNSDVVSLNGIFTIGVASQPKYITVSSQQKRAIHLANALNSIANSINQENNLKIAIIGGGIGGVSLAISLAKINEGNEKFNFEISLIEQAPTFCHLQRNCHIRRLHPNIHKWPLEGWNTKHSNYPSLYESLNWESDSASQFTKKLIKQYYKKIESKTNILANGKKIINSYRDCNEVYFAEENSKYKIIVSGSYDEGRFSSLDKYTLNINNIDIIFMATGMGLERGVQNLKLAEKNIKINSYWRNDTLSQTDISKKDNKYLISGNGDGGIVEIFRLLIEDYSQDETLEELIPTTISDEILNNLEIIDEYDRENADSITEQKSQGDFKSRYDNFIDFLIEQHKKQNEELNLYDIIDNYIVMDNKISSQNNSISILEFLSKLILPKIKAYILIYFLIKSNQKNKNNIQQVIDNQNITFYNRILFYFVWSLSNITIIKSKNNNLFTKKDIQNDEIHTDEILNIKLKYNILPENIIIRHGADATNVLHNFFYDSGKELNISKLLIRKVNSNNYRSDLLDGFNVSIEEITHNSKAPAPENIKELFNFVESKEKLFQQKCIIDYRTDNFFL